MNDFEHYFNSVFYFIDSYCFLYYIFCRYLNNPDQILDLGDLYRVFSDNPFIIFKINFDFIY